MNKKIKRVLFLFVILISLCSLQYLLFCKNDKKNFPEVKLKEIKNGKSFAIMILNKNGDGYEECVGNEWPNDKYKFKEAKCINNNGSLVKNAITFDDETRKATLTTNHTVYCTLYFDKSILGILRDNDPNKVLSNEEVGGMYRYQGVGKEEAIDDTHKLVDNNYICFGTHIMDECLNGKDKYMYRIIGITELGNLKLIKKSELIDNGNKLFVWSKISDYISCENDKCEWPNTILFKRINGLSGGITSGSGNVQNNGDTDIFVNSNEYKYMTEESEWYNLIENHEWMYGDVDYTTANTTLNEDMVYGVQNDGLTLYDIETGKIPTQIYDYLQGKYVKYQWSENKIVNAKIGLMYLHDYYLAYDNTKNYYSNYDTNSWLHYFNNVGNSFIPEWSMTRNGYSLAGDFPSYYTGYYISWDGSVSGKDRLYAEVFVRPTFYLLSNIKIFGKGTIDNPYLINV